MEIHINSLLNRSSIEEYLVVFSFGFLQIKLLWTVMYRFSCRHKLLFLWDKCSRAQLLMVPYHNCFLGQVYIQLFKKTVNSSLFWHPLNGGFCRAKVFGFGEVFFINFFFYVLDYAFGIMCKNSLSSMSQRFSSSLPSKLL